MPTTFTFSEKHLTDYHTFGYTVFREILPPALVRDLRRACDKGRELAREKSGPQAQRLQPVGKYAIDQQPFRDYAELPALTDAITRLLSPRHKHGDLLHMGVLFEPANHPWCTAWHRDWRDHMPAEVFEEVFRADWDRQVFDINLMNQINCALYDDGCTWYVPGSHYRQQNTPGEIASAHVDKPSATATDEELERWNLNYCQAMPGGLQLCLNAGDLAIYRASGWHLGNYLPYRKRATLHDSAMTPEYMACIQERTPRLTAAMKRWEEKKPKSAR